MRGGILLVLPVEVVVDADSSVTESLFPESVTAPVYVLLVQIAIPCPNTFVIRGTQPGLPYFPFLLSLNVLLR